MLARLQNQSKNNADIGAACAACSVMAGGVGRDILVKNLKQLLCFAIAWPTQDQKRQRPKNKRYHPKKSWYLCRSTLDFTPQIMTLLYLNFIFIRG